MQYKRPASGTSKKVLLGVIVLAFVASGCQWSSFGFDSGNSRDDPTQGFISTQNAATLTTDWIGNTGASIGTSSPVNGNGFVYIGSSNGELFAFDEVGSNDCATGLVTTCSPVWKSDVLGSPITSSPTVNGSAVYVTAGDRVYAYDGTGATSCSGTPKVCQPLWSTSTAGNADMSTPMVVNNVLYVHDSANLYAFDANGKQGCSGNPVVCSPLWTAPNVGATSTLPVAVLNSVVYTVGGGHLYAFDANGVTGCSGTPLTCRPLWEGAGAYGNSGVLASGSTVFTAGTSLNAYDAGGKTNCSGTPVVCSPLWTGSLSGNQAYSPMALANGTVFIVGAGALDAFPANGTTGCSGSPAQCPPLWTASLGGAQSTSLQASAPAVGGGVLFVGGADDKLYAFDTNGSVDCSGSPRTCGPLVTKLTGGPIYSSPTPTNSSVYVGSNDGNLYSFGHPAAYLNVTGSPLSQITASSPSALSPAFSNSVRDYTVRCASGLNTLSLTLTSTSGTITLNGSSGTTLNPSVPDVVPNQAVVVEAPDPSNPAVTTSYWIRCLPPDFPQTSVAQTGTIADPGYYLYGNVTIGSAGSSGTYAMVLNGNGTPVWYQKVVGGTNVEELAPDTIAWGGPWPSNAPYDVLQLDTQVTSTISAPNPPTDSHELLLAQGNYWLISNPILNNVNFSALGYGVSPMFDCVIEEVSPSGSLLWTWDAANHVGISETSPTLFGFVTYDGEQVADPYHCNSIDVDSTGSQVLVSMRNASALYDINRATGAINWKLGGTTATHDGEKVLTAKNDPESPFSGQHDARFQPNGDVSIYDDHTGLSGTSRGVEYSLNLNAGTATMDFQYLDPNGGAASATGGFRRYTDGDSVISWGFKAGSGFSEIDSNGHQLLRMSFPGNEFGYRALKVPLSSLNISVLRNTAGWPQSAG